MIHTVQGDIFNTKAEAIINPVNCVGVMGKGLALAFKDRFPDNYIVYRKLCKAHRLKVGQVLTYRLAKPEGELCYIVNFPTKDHWREPSKLSYIERGLVSLAVAIQETPIHSIAIPPLGCGLGGLDWAVVKPMIESALQDLSCTIYLYDKR